MVNGDAWTTCMCIAHNVHMQQAATARARNTPVCSAIGLFAQRTASHTSRHRLGKATCSQTRAVGRSHISAIAVGGQVNFMRSSTMSCLDTLPRRRCYDADLTASPTPRSIPRRAPRRSKERNAMREGGLQSQTRSHVVAASWEVRPREPAPAEEQHLGLA